MGNNSSNNRDCMSGRSYDNEYINYDPFRYTHSGPSMEERQSGAGAAMLIGGIADVCVTAVSAIADNRTYYCPRCGKRKYAYGAYAGNICLDCPGTVISAVGNTASLATFGIAKPVAVVLNHTGSEITQTVTSVTNAVCNIVTEDHNAGNGTKASSCGDIIFRISTKISNKNLESKYESVQISSITTKSCGIKFAIANDTGMDHWWMNINGIYQIQFRQKDSQIVLRKCESTSDCDETGLAEASRDENIDTKCESAYTKSVSGSSERTLGDLVNWLKSGKFSCHYSLYNNNCQDLCKEIYRWI